MAEHSNIAWTDATVNFWWGCTKVGPGCDHCYAEHWDARTGGAHWGVGVPRRKIESAGKLALKLSRNRPGARVFVQSMSDLFDLEVEKRWFAEAWTQIEICQNLRFQIVTKRISVVEKRLQECGVWGARGWPQHVGLMVTVCNQDEADRDVPRLLALKAKLKIPWVGLSIEPMLGPIDLTALNDDGTGVDNALAGMIHCMGKEALETERVNWVIVGGESKQGKDHQPRPFDLAWARSLRKQCAASRVAFFMKQLGANPISPQCTDGAPLSCHFEVDGRPYWKVRGITDKAGADPAEWPLDLQIREFPPGLRG